MDLPLSLEESSIRPASWASPATRFAAGELGSAIEAMTARARIARIAIEAGSEAASIAPLVGPGLPHGAIARVALGKPATGALAHSLIAFPFEQLGELVHRSAWRIRHALTRGLLDAISCFEESASKGFPEASWLLERDGLAVVGAWDCSPRDIVFQSAAFGRFAARALLSLAVVECMTAEPEQPSADVALAVAGYGEFPPTGIPIDAREACMLLLFDSARPFSVAFCLGQMQAAGAQLGIDEPARFSEIWRELTTVHDAQPTPAVLHAVANLVISVQHRAIGPKPQYLSTQRSEASGPDGVGQ